MPDSGEFLDPYLDPETGILRNRVSARTKESLDDAEASLSFARLVQLMDQPPKPTGDLTELQEVHRHLKMRQLLGRRSELADVPGDDPVRVDAGVSMLNAAISGGSRVTISACPRTSMPRQSGRWGWMFLPGHPRPGKLAAQPGRFGTSGS
jgi:hypothetical protein